MAGNIVTKIDDKVKIRTVLASVSDKSGLDDLINALVEINPQVRILSTGGTYNRIREILGAEWMKFLETVSSYTGQPETQGGLVKTLDFKIYLGLLTETYNKAHQGDLRRTGAVPIDLVVCNLYPFVETVAREGVTVEDARSNIDIGGPTMIRAAAKNYLRTAVVTRPGDYAELICDLQKGDGCLSLESRFNLAKKAFEHTAEYDKAVSDYLNGCDSSGLSSLYSLGASV